VFIDYFVTCPSTTLQRPLTTSSLNGVLWTETGRTRSVRPLAPLGADLAAWRLASDSAGADELVCPALAADTTTGATGAGASFDPLAVSVGAPGTPSERSTAGPMPAGRAGAGSATRPTTRSWAPGPTRWRMPTRVRGRGTGTPRRRGTASSSSWSRACRSGGAERARMAPARSGRVREGCRVPGARPPPVTPTSTAGATAAYPSSSSGWLPRPCAARSAPGCESLASGCTCSASAATSSPSPGSTPRPSASWAPPRADYRARQDQPAEDGETNDGSTVVLSVRRYLGSGYLNPGDVLLAAGVEASLRAAHEALNDLRRGPPSASAQRRRLDLRPSHPHVAGFTAASRAVCARVTCG
jgi:hypothetical protein